MNSAYLKNIGPRIARRRVALSLSLIFLLALSLIPATAQKRAQKRITSVWTATSAEGSRVHVVSDSPVSDYEAYTRGDRFYVKIPLADLPSARGSLLGRGFDDVQIQRYGDGLIISFRLQPGTTARVEQNLNQLEVVFSTPGRSQSGISSSNNAEAANRTRARRISDSAGPTPSSSSEGQRRKKAAGQGISSSTRKKVAASDRRKNTEISSPAKKGESNKKTSVEPQPGQASSSRNAGSSASATTSGSKEAKSSPSPLTSKSPAAMASPGGPGSGSLVSASPFSTPAPVASSTVQQPSSAPELNPGSTSVDNDWRSRVHYWKVWAELNWLPLVIGGLIGFALLVVLFFWRGAKRSRVTADESTPEPTVPETVATNSSAPPLETSTAGERLGAPAVAPSNQTNAAVQPISSTSPPSDHHKPEDADQEREVFEL